MSNTKQIEVGSLSGLDGITYIYLDEDVAAGLRALGRAAIQMAEWLARSEQRSERADAINDQDTPLILK